MHDKDGDVRAMFEAQQDATGILDADARWTRVNSRFAALMGRPKEYFPNENLCDLLPSGGESAVALHAQVLSSGRPELGVRILCAGLGATAALGVADLEEDWAPLGGDGFTGVAIHIHAAKGAAADNLTSPGDMREDKRLQALITAIPVPIAVFDKNMGCVAANRRHLEAFGPSGLIRPVDSEAGHDARGIGPDLPGIWRAGHGRVLAGETLSDQTDRYPRPDGSIDWVRWGMTPLHGIDGGVDEAMLCAEVMPRQSAGDIALHDSEARSQRAQRAGAVGTWEVDLETGQRWWSDGFRWLYGLGPDVPASTAEMQKHVHPDDYRAIAAAIVGLPTSQDGRFETEIRFRRADNGQERHLLVRGELERAADGTPLRVVGASIDNTAQHALQRQRDYLARTRSAILDGIPAQVALLNAEGVIVAVNARWHTAFRPHGPSGETSDAVEGINYLELCQSALDSGDSSAAQTLDGLRSILSGRINHLELEYACGDPNGGRRWFRVVAAPVLVDDANRGAVVTHFDITELMNARGALEQREARLAAIIDTMPEAMVVTDEQDRIELFSKSAERMFGWSAERAKGCRAREMIAESDRARYDVDRRRDADRRRDDDNGGSAGPTVAGRPAVGRHSSGATFPIETVVGRLQFGGRRLLIRFVRDVTEARATQARLQGLQTELLHAARMGDAGAMTAALAHELGQPLTSLTSAVGAARRMLLEQGSQLSGAEPLAALDFAAKQALRAGSIVRNLREFVSRGVPTQRTEDLAQIVENTGALALVGTREQGVHVSFDLAADLPPVLADRVQIQQVLFNLMRNAIEAFGPLPPCNESGVPVPQRMLVVKAQRTDEATVEVSVTDSGPGLDPSIADHVFEPFRTSKEGGMGVGLAICEMIIEAHQGRIWVTQNVGAGVSFHFTLPVATSREHVPTTGAKSEIRWISDPKCTRRKSSR